MPNKSIVVKELKYSFQAKMCLAVITKLQSLTNRFR